MTALAASIEDHRAMYKADLLIPKLVSRQPPTTLDPHTGELHVEPGAATGMPMSGRLLKYLGHPEGYGADFPWSKAWNRLRTECRRRHRHHRGPKHWNGSLCHQLVAYVIVQGWSVHNAAQILDYDNPEPVLRSAFSFMESTIDDYRAKAERRAREEAGHGPGAIPVEVPPHHAVPGLHRVDCPQCRREGAA